MIHLLKTRPSAGTLALVVLAALVFNLQASAWLNDSYALSRFPVPYFQAQLSFDASAIKGWYAQLIDMGTLDIYVRTQHIDFLFIVSVLLLHVSALLLVSRLFPAESCGRRWMVGAALLSASAPAFDALENAVSYLMLANPLDFADGLALLYSSLAALKFAIFTFAYVALPMGVMAGLATRWQGRGQKARAVVSRVST
jgi:hypothetical protein